MGLTLDIFTINNVFFKLFLHTIFKTDLHGGTTSTTTTIGSIVIETLIHVLQEISIAIIVNTKI